MQATPMQNEGEMTLVRPAVDCSQGNIYSGKMRFKILNNTVPIIMYLE